MRIKEMAEVENAYVNLLKVLDYEPTKEILDAVYVSFLSGSSKDEIVGAINTLTKLKNME